ncbi:8d4a970a-aaab-4329-badb-0b88011bf5b9 [Sclerotinia trifoliorum]|uniref:8d4a970a-aaab-4329-badb-0b88011bf5b9 n=1 Tax=Sclerotinia trifoliorum TaxID=28548 RepID=A0A8H2ZS25_9HELO|nr:8d4a970a-aaab-4329-badb-0b88011bf5b9 [Sclerotinia trifoliorum]
MRIIPRNKLRELVTDILKINAQNQKWLVNAWENEFDDLDIEYDGDANEDDPHALVVFMDEKSPITHRVLICDMGGSNESIRKYFKEK